MFAGMSVPVGDASLYLQRRLPWLVAVAFFMETLDTTILNTSVPAIAQSMGVPPLNVKSVLASYTLTLALFTPISGWLADRYGTRNVFGAAIGLFTLGSVLCGLATNVEMLIACRILQGMGGALLVPVGRMTLIRAFEKADLVRVMNFISIPALIGQMIGPVAGGLITSYFGWRGVFWVNVPFGLVGLYLVYRFLPDYREVEIHSLDYAGFALFGSGITLLSYVLEVFGEHNHDQAEILVMLAISTALLVGYSFHSKHTMHPLLNVRLFKIRTFRAAVGGGFITRLGINGAPFLFPLLFQIGLGLSPALAGLLLLPQAIAAVALKKYIPSLLEIIGYRNSLLYNTVLLGLMIMSFSLVNAQTPLWLITFQTFVLGFFTSMQYTCMNTLAYVDVEASQTSAASTIATTWQQLATSVGVAGAGVLAALLAPQQLQAHSAEITYGVRLAFLVLGTLTIFSSFAFFILKAEDGENVSQHTMARSSHSNN